MEMVGSAGEGSGWQLRGSSAEAYEEYLVPAIFGPWAVELVDLAAPRPGDRVLDVACGTGAVIREVAHRVGSSGSLSGVDLNPTMLETAARRSATEAPIEWREASAIDLPFPGASFDLVLCQQALQFVDDPERAIREMRRVLADGGRLAVATWCGLGHNRPFALFAEALERHSAPAGDIMRSPFALGDRDELRALLSTGGLVRQRLLMHCRVSRFPSISEFLRHEMLASPLAGPLGQLDQAAFDALVADVTATLDPYVDDDGLAVPMASYLGVAQATAVH
jgi:SAM-dependent methyltransferase